MSGSIASSFLSPNELLAPREYWDRHQQVQDQTRRTDLLAQHQSNELELSDQAQIANTAGYLLSLPDENARASAWSKIYPSLPDHVRARAPASYQGQDWLQGVQARAVPALERWKLQQQTEANRAILDGAGGGAPAAGAAAPAANTSYGAGGPAASLTVPPEYMPYFQEASQRYGIPVDRLIAQARQESGFNARARGAAGERGIMQIKDSTAQAPGFGVDPVDPATLDDARTNIMFGTAYLRGRMGPGDANDPAVWHRGLAGYNGGGDPNYVANVTRYLPAPSRGVAARTGGVDVAGPGVPPSGPAAPDTGPGTAPGSAMAPDVLDRVRTLAGAGGPPNALTAPPGAVPADVAPAAPALAPTPPAATPAATPEQIATQLGIDPNSGLTQRDKQVLSASAGRMSPDQMLTAMEQMRARNQARVQQAYTQQRQMKEDAEKAPMTQLQLQEARRKAAAAEEAAKEPLYTGNEKDEQDYHILHYRDPKSAEYREAYARQAAPKQTGEGVWIYPNMGAYKKPLDDDGKPVEGLDKPGYSIGPGNVGKLREKEEAASTLIRSLDDFLDRFTKASSGERIATVSGAPTNLGSAWTNAALMAKGEGLYKLGVLSGPDMDVLRGALADPKTFMGAMATQETVKQQVDRIKGLVQAGLEQSRRSYGGGMSADPDMPRDGRTPGAAAPAGNGDPIKVTGAADYAKVPSGGLYVDPQGNTRRKR